MNLTIAHLSAKEAFPSSERARQVSPGTVFHKSISWLWEGEASQSRAKNMESLAEATDHRGVLELDESGLRITQEELRLWLRGELSECVQEA